MIGPERLRELEPHAAGIRGLRSPHTSVVDFGAVARAYAQIVTSAGGQIILGHRVEAIHTAGDAVTIDTQVSSITSRSAIACVGSAISIYTNTRMFAIAPRGSMTS